MKMRKSTWLLLVLALVAIFLVAGCAPTTPTNGEEPNGEEPTPPPADKECPEVVSTKVTKTGADSFRLVITFDETINSSCIETITNWVVDVTNPGRVGEPVVTITDVEVDGKVVTVRATVVETGEAGEPGVEYDLVPFTTPFTTLGAAIDAANDLVEAVGIVNGRVLFGADWLVFLDALDAAEEAAEAAPEEALTGALNALASALEANNINAIIVALNGLADVLDEDAFDELDFGALAVALGDLRDALAGFGEDDAHFPLAGLTNAEFQGMFGDIDAAFVDLIGALTPATADYGDAVAALEDLADALDALNNVQKLALAAALGNTTVAVSVDAVVDALEDLVEQVQDLAEDFIDAALAEALDALNAAFEGLGVMAVSIIIPGTPAPVFEGLICNKDDAKRYVETFGLDEDHVPTFADEVSWELSDCAVYDDLGNVCCDFSGEACCVEPYCEECEEDGCDLTEPGACL